ncbi:MAG TPA: PQQ-binding-like beta-propeller repeat protein [Verrucomicrobiota bacterium]|nr:pyrrolo-quinoline quinone [Verrucomicrobiales bacterium]HRI13865.1 PQQ-binding-like beta-propeller repeat protein [Verrucomicrobiota bacterium]
MHPIQRSWARAIILVMAVGHSLAANWPQYRGPSASGVDNSRPAPTEWKLETGQNIAWQTPIPGLAHAAPIIWGNRVYVATAVKPGAEALKVGLYGDIESVDDRDTYEWRLLALDRETGAVTWNQLAHTGIPRVKRHPKATHCNSTPATDGQRIAALFGSEGLWCFDAAGKVLWKKDLGPMDSGYFESPSAQWGFASSPVLYDGKVIVQCDVQTNSFLAVFDATDGRDLWRTPRRDVPTWSTPTVVVAGGRTQIAVNGWHHTGGYDFVTGSELWRLDGGGDIPVPTPVFAHDLIYFTSAHGRWRPVRAIRPNATGDITPADPGQTNASIVWAQGRQGGYMQTPIVVGDLLWSCTDSGVLTCFDAMSGVIKYSERLASGGGQGYTASPVSDGRNLFFVSEIGNVFVVPAKAQFAVLTFSSLGETCLATPALSDGTLFFRTRSKLIAVKSKPQ